MESNLNDKNEIQFFSEERIIDFINSLGTSRDQAIKISKFISQEGENISKIESNENKNIPNKRNYSEAFKKEIVNEANKTNNNSTIAKKLKIDESTVRKWRSELTSKEDLIKIKKKREETQEIRGLYT